MDCLNIGTLAYLLTWAGIPLACPAAPVEWVYGQRR